MLLSTNCDESLTIIDYVAEQKLSVFLLFASDDSGCSLLHSKRLTEKVFLKFNQDRSSRRYRIKLREDISCFVSIKLHKL